MKAIDIHQENNRYLISIDKSKVDKDFVIKLIELLRMEILANEISLDESILKIGEEIKSEWWEKNKPDFLK